ncbi:C4-type zinc ribbon domain-containing protein [Verrucomicrobiales bacterium]|jgi:predicted  nucleic acid-binding Zn-ribbon protein|nr:C4-type zinc ribbon domain-containing protein [bacterium]MDC0504459.1 C4-type zinc ribbon domain-containing protein [Verrucomicrobiales bacterium]MDF1787168.1 C4-type zinc ribbon domain-containing protein [Verrucomicrobiales bacterium]
MLPELEKLLVIQDRDEKIRDARKEMDRIPLDEDKAKTRLSGDNTAVSDAKTAAQENEVAIKALELEVETCQQTRLRLKTQQFETRKNEEFSALGHEIERYGKQITEIEDRQLELMEKAETLKKAHDDATAQLAATQKLVDEELEDLKQRQQVSQDALDKMIDERKELASKVDPDTLDLYDRLAVKKGTVIVRVDDQNQMCGGCHMQVTTQTFHHARAEQEITHCEQCNRILYVIDHDA